MRAGGAVEYGKHPDYMQILKLDDEERKRRLAFFELTEERVLKTPLAVSSGNQALLETGQQIVIAVNAGKHKPVLAGYENCPVLKLTSQGRLVQSQSFCL